MLDGVYWYIEFIVLGYAAKSIDHSTLDNFFAVAAKDFRSQSSSLVRKCRDSLAVVCYPHQKE